MPLIPEARLRERAREECLQAMSSLLHAELSVESGASQVAWDPNLKRTVFEQSFVVWREYDEVEILVSSKGAILSFRDRNRFKGMETVELQPLASPEILEIAGATGLLGELARVDRAYFDEERMLVAVVSQSEPDLPSRIKFSINVVHRQVAAFRVLRGAGS